MDSATPSAKGAKRAKQPSTGGGDTDIASPSQSSPGCAKLESPVAQSSGSSSATSAFRNVSACNRCRVRKNRCDQKLPACSSCERANTKCVGFDPVSKREIPRSYVYYLECRLSHLEATLHDHGIAFPPADDLAANFNLKPASDVAPQYSSRDVRAGAQRPGSHNGPLDPQLKLDPALREGNDRAKLDKLVSNIGMVSVQGASDPRYLGSTSGISFARVVFAAVKSSVSSNSSERAGVRPSKPLPHNTATGVKSMRDSFFGLQIKPTIKPAPFPEKELGTKLVSLYFEHANPQIPTLHRGEFMNMFDRVYASHDKKRTARELYMLNIVFAIGSGIIMDSSDTGNKSQSVAEASDEGGDDMNGQPSRKKLKTSNKQHEPEQYHASAILHLETFLGSSPASEGAAGGLEELQAVLLLAGYALLRPVAPGLWYIIGVAVRLAVDLGLHYEDHDGIGDEPVEDSNPDNDQQEGSSAAPVSREATAREKGRRQWTKDLRRRLWWSVYSLDRLVSTCVGRPFGITDQVITTEFPSLLDDKYITTNGFITTPTLVSHQPTYKHISHHYFRLRLLQSEILQVLQHRQAQQARVDGASEGNVHMHTKLPSPFLHNFTSFRDWRDDVDRRLWEWKLSAPNQAVTGVNFSPLFLELNYWQAIIMLYRPSLSVPPVFAGDLDSSIGGDVQSSSMHSVEEHEDEEKVFMKVAEAGQRVIKIYRQLHRIRLVNYTFLATHHLFMSGISFLYAIWHSTVVRSQLTLDDVDFTVLAATSVLGDLIDKCPPAEACRDAFDRMSKATISMCMSTTGFGNRQAFETMSRSNTNESQSQYYSGNPQRPFIYTPRDQTPPSSASGSRNVQSRRPPPRFDMNLRDLFSEEEVGSRTQNRAPATTLMYPPPPSQPHPPQLTQEPSSLNHMTTQPQPQQPTLTRPSDFGPTSATNVIDPALQNTTPFSPMQPSLPPPLQQQQQQTQPQTSTPHTPEHSPYAPFAQPSFAPSTMPDNSFQNLDFLDSMPDPDDPGANGVLGGDLDLGFGVGGMAWHGSGGAGWDDSAGFDLFDGFFFGNNGAGGGMAS
ncbi:hypothetical protein LTR66_004748 [Elasticomyces elasticus]|nr:hypothetical protein LTR66_004748 [Elasticomyces elasticus]